MKPNAFLLYWWNKDVLGDGYGWEATTVRGEKWLRTCGRTEEEAKANLKKCLPKHEAFKNHKLKWAEPKDAFKYGTMENAS